jgi:CBS domain-containing protein
MGKLVRDVMTSSVRSLSPSQSLADAATLMKNEDVGSLPVAEQGRLIGIVTDRDIVIRAVVEQRDARVVKVEEVMSRDPITVTPEQDLEEALRLMGSSQVRRLPVVEKGRLIGIMAQADLGLGASEKEVGETVEEISKPASRRAA